MATKGVIKAIKTAMDVGWDPLFKRYSDFLFLSQKGIFIPGETIIKVQSLDEDPEAVFEIEIAYRFIKHRVAKLVRLDGKGMVLSGPLNPRDVIKYYWTVERFNRKKVLSMDRDRGFK